MERMKPNRARQADNLSRFTGFKDQKYYRNGVWQPNKKKHPEQYRRTHHLPQSGNIFTYKKR